MTLEKWKIAEEEVFVVPIRRRNSERGKPLFCLYSCLRFCLVSSESPNGGNSAMTPMASLLHFRASGLMIV